MLSRVEALNDQGALLVLPLTNTSDGIILKSIEGLGPVKATLVSSSFARLDGEQYHSSRREPRDLKFIFGLEAMYGGGSVREIRKRLYKFFMTKRAVNLAFVMEDGLVVNIDGRVESNDQAMFAKEPEMEVVVRCFDPDLIDPTIVTISGNTTSTETETLLEYDGSVETGIIFKLNVNRTLSEFTIYHRPPDGSILSMDFAAPLVAGDVLTISTIPGSKGASVLRSGTSIPILYGVSPYANWIALQEGVNHIRIYAVGAAIPYTIEYTNRYGGL